MNSICQSCGRKLGKGDGRLRCRKCQPVRQTAPALHTKIVDTDTIKMLNPPAPMKPAQRYCDCGTPLGPGNHSGMCLPCRTEQPIYLPTQEQIAEECAKIRAGWTEDVKNAKGSGRDKD